MQLTQTEAWYLGESIKGETLMSQKLTSYREMAQDPNYGANSETWSERVRTLEPLIKSGE